MANASRTSFVVSLAGAVILFAACGQDRTAESQARLQALEARFEALSKELEEVRNDVAMQKLMTGRYEAVTLDPSARGYGRVDTDSGFFLVSVEDARPYLDGYKMVLHVGNPQAVRYTGFKIKARWGPKFKAGDDYTKWQAALQEKESSYTQTLEPGAWNTVELVLSPAASKAVGYLEIRMAVNQVRLSVPR